MRLSACFLHSIVTYIAKIGKQNFCFSLNFGLDPAPAFGFILSLKKGEIAMNAKEAAARSGASVRALRYYEQAGLIHPARRDNDYRDYGEADSARVRLIRAYRALQFTVSQIRELLEASDVRRDALLQAHIDALEEKRRQIDNRLALVKSVWMLGTEHLGEMDLETLDAQMSAAQKRMEQDENLRALSERFKAESQAHAEAMAEGLMDCFAAIADAEDAGESVEALRAYIGEHLYPCTDEMLRIYARSYGGNGALGRMLEERCGEGAAKRVRERIEARLAQEASKREGD